MKLKLIVAAVDIKDDLARAVILAATDLAWRDHAAVHIVSAWPRMPPSAVVMASPMGPLGGDMSPELLAADKEARAHDEAAMRALASAAAPSAKVVMLDGEPGQAIDRYARDVEADVIVVGSHQRGFWSSIFESGASKDVVKGAPCGVFLVTRPYAERLLVEGAG